MKPVLMPVTTDEFTLWQAYVDAKAKADHTGAFPDAVEAKRCLKAFYCYESSVIQKNLGAV
ncbi:hypothetical protein KHQ08_07000 [Pseudochrobactrum algeriensis]|uniref:hypothetical protein n=1 Tax=Pseudochrobactrum algeriensis TaxID=2834768 RepID=UPI001BD17A23|nr:hypothetical protein [Pseudochrobactrum algeriensis]QVQ37762.1 hypothetical protein KHQ08_07000 [Pseudochrobactrum algeriensis]QVQ40982.1 hypothetical protein KHQ07_05300 [Pseudochrobactrum algeriensis]QVQ44906.1 hypothetical protein KHQ09_07265 [Pseudochrobactrum algeriensis]